jgi:phage shock protein A
MPPWILPAIVGVLASAIIATGMAAVVQMRAADEARAERDALRAEVDELRNEIQQLEAELEDERAAHPTARPAARSDALGGLLDGGSVPRDLGELLTRTGERVATLRELAWTEDVGVALLDDAERSGARTLMPRGAGPTGTGT